MHPTHLGAVSDGHHRSPRPAAAAAAAAQPASSPTPSLVPRRRPHVDSNPSLQPAALLPDAKRAKTAPSPSAAAMSVKMQSKQPPEIVDLTASPPPTSASASAPTPFGAGSRAPRGLAAMGTTATAPSAYQPHIGARKLVIKNLRAAPDRGDELGRYYDRTWTEIGAALAAVFAGQQPRQPLERLRRGVEDLCMHGQADQLYRKLWAVCEAHLFKTVLPRIRADVHGKSDIEVLRLVHREWLTWKKQSEIVRSTFKYLDCTYLANERLLMSTNDMLVTRFRRMAFDGPKRAPADTTADAAAEASAAAAAGSGPSPGRRSMVGMCDLVAQDRHRDAAFDAALLADAVRMAKDLGVYNVHFEPLFLETSLAYLREVAEEREANAPLKQYIQACQVLLQREDVRCNAFELDSATKKQLLGSAQQLLITERQAKLLDPEAVAKLLDSNDVESMRALYELLRLAKLHKKLRAPWEAYVEATGSAIVMDVARGDEMVVRLLLLRRSLDVMVRDAYARDDDFMHGMRDAFARFINNRRVSKAWTSGAAKVGEMVAKYIDMLLRGGLKTLPAELLSDRKDRADAERSGQASTGDEDAELDRQLDHGLELFRFIQGKDVFEAFYKKDLARRLLMGRSASRDAERNMLSKLKTECGPILTHNLEQMFRDQELSRDEMAAYKQWLDSTGRKAAGDAATTTATTTGSAVDLQVSVLSASAWPTYQEVELNLPPAVLAQVNLFDTYYKNKHSGRQLTWMHSLGHCVVRARFNKGAKELLLSSFQAAVLMLFNAAEAAEADGGTDGILSYAQIADGTRLGGSDLVRTLQSLACGKVRVLSKQPKGRDVSATDTFTVNKAFTDPKYRIKINQIQLKETREENAATYERVAADRQFETQAAIVRIMKSRKTLPHAQLVAEVISQTVSRGALDPADIKQNIEKLIEKDYLDREEGNYVYLA